MKNILKISILFLLVACNSKSPLLQAPPEKFQSYDTPVGDIATVSEPKVNILFVVDNSGSMKGHQATMLKNLDIFVEQFFKNPRIDYKIGVVPVYDSRYLDDKTIYDNGRGVRKMNPYAQLVPLKNEDGSSIEAPPYVTRETPNAKDVLKRTLNLGIQWGPEAEESFSPVLGVMNLGAELGGVYAKTQAEATKHNQGFYDKDAYLVVIFLTDADDATDGLSAHSFYTRMVLEKGGDKNKVSIAAANPDPKKHSATCSLDGAGPIYKFPDLISASRGELLDLCSGDFGSKLANFGQDVVNKVATQVIHLNYVPDSDVYFTYGAKDTPKDKLQIITMKTKGGFTINNKPDSSDITLSPNLEIERVPGGELQIHTTHVKMSNQKLGRAKPVSKAKKDADAKAAADKKQNPKK